jgi:hypothetical protein
MADATYSEAQLEEACADAYQDGYAEGQNDATSASNETFSRVIAWLQKRDMLDARDYPEGYTAEDILEMLNEHEENLVALAERGKAYLREACEIVRRNGDALPKRIADFANVPGPNTLTGAPAP